MAPAATVVTGKRKRDELPSAVRGSTTKKPAAERTNSKHKVAARTTTPAPPAPKKGVPHDGDEDEDGDEAGDAVHADADADADVHVQIVTGSYERVLHGLAARIPRERLRGDSGGSDERAEDVAVTDTFLFAAHAAAIRCLAISPPTAADKRLVATGSSDERINVYSVSTAPPPPSARGSGAAAAPALGDVGVRENPRNRSLGSLMHHDRPVTCLTFPAKGKLFSAAEDNTIAITRTRDWTALSSIKAPLPSAHGRPSGDTAAPGETPAGIHDVAVHPSQKLMLSVGRGERCLRLWNLMTGKKAGVLNFDRAWLAQAGEGRASKGEGVRVRWDAAGESYVVGFERGAAVFGLDSKPRAIATPSPPTKLHQMRVLRVRGRDILAVSTEDGRIVFFGMDALAPPTTQNSPAATQLPLCPQLAELGGPSAGVRGRIKDFEILERGPLRLVVSGSSDGTVRLWTLPDTALLGTGDDSGKDDGDRDNGHHNSNSKNKNKNKKSSNGTDKNNGGRASTNGTSPHGAGRLVGVIETGNRITCLGAFIMDGHADAGDGTGADAADLGAGEDPSPASDSDESE